VRAADFAAFVTGAKRRADGVWWDARCPAHEDHHASLSFRDGDRGVLMLKCQARSGCTPETIAAALGLTLKDLRHQPPANGHHGTQRPDPAREVVYDYTDSAGTLLFQVVRRPQAGGDKTFRQRRPDPERPGQHLWNLAGVTPPLYRLPELAEQRQVVVCEGEKDVESLRGLGLVATTSAMGAKHWHARYAETLARLGAETIVVIPDHDDEGEHYAAEVARTCRAAGIRVGVLRLEGLPPHGDVTDWLNAGHPADELRAILEQAAQTATTEQAPEPEAPAPTLTVEGDDYRLAWPDGNAEIRLASLHEDSNGLHAEVTVTRRGEVLSWGRLNLVSTSMREGLLKKLETVASDVGWRAILERACFDTAARFRQGAPIVVLRPVQSAAPRLLIDPLLPLHETAVIYGDGGSGKSYLSLALALALLHEHPLPGGLRPMQRASTLILDWEACEDDLNERLARLEAGLGLTHMDGIYYRPMARALADDATRLRAEVARLDVGLLIVDSGAPACGTDPETANAAIRIMNALRSFPTTNLILAHVNQLTAAQRQGVGRPFGSVFNWNLARSLWEIRASDERPTESELSLALFHRKVNRGRQHPPIGLCFSFAPDRVTLGRTDLAQAPDLLARTSLAHRICMTLASGAMTAEALAETIDAKPDSVSRVLRRLGKAGKVLRLDPDTPGGPNRWGLPA